MEAIDSSMNDPFRLGIFYFRDCAVYRMEKQTHSFPARSISVLLRCRYYLVADYLLRLMQAFQCIRETILLV